MKQYPLSTTEMPTWKNTLDANRTELWDLRLILKQIRYPFFTRDGLIFEIEGVELREVGSLDDWRME